MDQRTIVTQTARAEHAPAISSITAFIAIGYGASLLRAV
jgi:hypothetical protein